MSLQDLLKDAGGDTDTQKHRAASASPTSLTSLLTTAKPISPVANDNEADQAPQLPQATIRAYNPETDGGNKPFNNLWTRIGQTVLPEFLQKELNIDETQRQDKPRTPAQQESVSGNLITKKAMQENPAAVDPLEYLRRGLSFGHDLDPTNTFAGYQKDLSVSDLPEPVTTKQKIAEAIGSVLTMSVAQPLIEAGAASLVAGLGTKIPALARATEAVSTAVKLRPWTVGYATKVASATATGGLFGLIEKNKETLAHNVLTTAGEFAAFTALAFPIQQFFKPIIEQVGKATLDNASAQKVLGSADITSKPIAQTIWFRNPKDPTQLLKVTAQGATFTKTGGAELAASGMKAENLPTMTSLQVEAFKENPSLYASLKDWIGGKIPKKTTIEFASPEDFAKATPVEVVPGSNVKPSEVRDQVAATEAKYKADPSPENEAAVVEQRQQIAEYRESYAQPVVETENIKVQVLPFDEKKWDVQVSANAGDANDGITIPFGSSEKLYPSKDAAIKGGLKQVSAWANEKGYSDLAQEAADTAKNPAKQASTPPESSRMAFNAPQTTEDVQGYLEDGTKRYGSRAAFLKSDEYAAYHAEHGDQVSSLFAQTKAAGTEEGTKTAAEELGFKVGDRVETTVDGEKVGGTVRTIGGRSFVLLDTEMPTSKDGKTTMRKNVELTDAFKKVKGTDTTDEASTKTPALDIPKDVADGAAKDWEENHADGYQETADEISKLQAKAKESGKAEAAKLQKKIDVLIAAQSKEEEAFLAEWRAKASKPATKKVADTKEIVGSYDTPEEFAKAVIYHGTTPDYAPRIERNGFKGNTSFSYDFDTALSYTSEDITEHFDAESVAAQEGGTYHPEDVIAAVPRKGAENIGTDGADKLTGEDIYKPEDVVIVGRGKQTPKELKAFYEKNKAPARQENAAYQVGEPVMVKVQGGEKRGTVTSLSEDGKNATVKVGGEGTFTLELKDVRPAPNKPSKRIGLMDYDPSYTPHMRQLIREAQDNGDLFPYTKMSKEEQGIVDAAMKKGLENLMEKPPVRIAKKTVEKKKAAAEKKAPAALPTLPKEIEGAKPRYGYQDKQFTLAFNNDVDKALYIVAQSTPSKADAAYMDFLRGIYPKDEDPAIRARGAEVRNVIKSLAKDAEKGGELEVPNVMGNSSLRAPEPEAKPRMKDRKLRLPATAGNASTGKTNIGNFEPVNDANGADYNLKLFEEVQKLIEKYAARIGEGYLPRGALGVHYPTTGSIRVSGMNDLSTAAHEIAHFIDHKFDITDRITTPTGYKDIPGMGTMPIYDKEEGWLRKGLTDVYVNYYPGASRTHPLPKRMVEGFATFVQKYMEMPKTMTEKFPKLVDAFFKPGGKYYVKDINDLVDEARKIVEIYQGLDPLDKIGARVTHDTQVVDKDPFMSLGDRIRTETVDNLFPLEKLAIKAGNAMTPADPSLWARAYNNSSAMVLTNINSDRGYWSFREGKFVKLHDYNWKTLVKQLETEKNGDAFNYWLIARDQYFNYQELAKLKEQWEAMDAQLLRQEHGEEIGDFELPVTKTAVDEVGQQYKDLKQILERNGFTEKEVTAAYEANAERFAKEGEMFDALVREDLNFMNDTQVQLVNNEDYTKLISREGYASLKRDFYDEIAGDMVDGSGNRAPGGVKASSLKQRTGSARAILPPMDSAIRNHAEMTKKALKQIVYNRIGDIGISAVFPDLFHVTELKAVPDGTGMIHYPQERDPDIIMARRGYKRVPILTDRLIKRTVDELLNPQNMGYFEQLVVGASRLFTKGTTGIYAPFALSNYTIDQITATAQSTQKYVPLLTPIKTLMKVMADRQDESEAAKYFMEYLVLGGERQTMIGWQDMSPRELERRIKGEVDGLMKVIDYANKGLDVLGLPSKWSEIATRATEYIQARMNGSEAIVALEQAGRVTAPFHHVGRLGGSNAGKMFIKSIPFFNPMLQVLDQAIRSGFSKSQAARQRYWFVTAAVIASLVGSLFVINKKGTQEQKDLYTDLDPQMLTKYVFIPNPNGKTLIRIRVPDQMAVVGSIMNMAIADQIMNTRYDVGNYLDAATAWLPQQMQLNKPAEALLSWIPQILKPGIEVAANIKDFPSVIPLESQAQQNKPAGLRFTEGTSPVAKWLGKEFNVSPIKLDYLLTGYFGRATGYLTAKPGIYNPASVVNQTYYFSSGRRVQDYYDLRQKNDELYNAYTHKLQTFPVGTPSKIIRQRAIIGDTYDLLKLYSDVDPEKDPQKAQDLRQRILNSIDKADAIKI